MVTKWVPKSKIVLWLYNRYFEKKTKCYDLKKILYKKIPLIFG